MVVYPVIRGVAMYVEHDLASIGLRAGMPVEVATHFTGSWTGGFEIASVFAERCRVRRVSDGAVLPVDFDCADVRAAHCGKGCER